MQSRPFVDWRRFWTCTETRQGRSAEPVVVRRVEYRRYRRRLTASNCSSFLAVRTHTRTHAYRFLYCCKDSQKTHTFSEDPKKSPRKKKTSSHVWSMERKCPRKWGLTNTHAHAHIRILHLNCRSSLKARVLFCNVKTGELIYLLTYLLRAIHFYRL